MSDEDVKELAAEIVAPVREMVECYDPEGCARWVAAVEVRLRKEIP